MSKPNEIPQEMWDTAGTVMACVNVDAHLRQRLQEGIAYAIFAERARCAAVAEDCWLQGTGNEDTAIEMQAIIVAAIRSNAA